MFEANDMTETKIPKKDASQAGIQKARENFTQYEAVDAETMQTIFSKRALALGSRTRLQQAEKTRTPTLIFLLGKEKYAVSLQKILEVLPSVQNTPIPEAPREILGVMNHRGDIRTIVDLAVVLGLPSDKENEHATYIIMVRMNNQEIGLKVDAIESTSAVDLAECIEPPIGSRNLSMGYVQGVTQGSVHCRNR